MDDVRRACAWLVILAATISPGSPSSAQGTAAEYQLKAAFVSKFPEFTEWPEAALDGRDTVDLCVARPNPFGTALSELVTGEVLRGRRLVTRDIDSPAAIDHCQVLFVSGLPPNARRLLLARAATLPMLTVGDYPAFLDEGGIVSLRIVAGRVRFDVNVEASSRVGIRLGSQLLRLAANVRGGTR